MGNIDHLLCTHCTFGTSALESATPDNATKVLGYSVRASSIRDRTKLRDEFRAVERLLSYDLPSDSTADHKKQLNAATAPVRLCFLPDIAGRQVVGQIAFRQFDTANRPGSYFAHLLVEPVANAWSVLDCLRLWGICDPSGCQGWAANDTPAGFPDIGQLPSLTTWLGSDRGWLDDNVATAFVRNGTSGKTAGPGTSIPARWANDFNDAERLGLVAAILQSLLEKQVLPTVVLAIEPLVAAVCFYAALRLLPAKLRMGVGFSTYEHDPAKAPTRLAATTFVGTGSDFKPQVYQSEFLVVNTFRGPPFSSGAYKPTPGTYTRWAIKQLADGRCTRVDELCRFIDKVWSQSVPGVSELDQLPVLEDLREKIFRGNSAPIPSGLTQATSRFLALRCSERVRSAIPTLAQQPAGTSASLIRQLETVFLGAPEEWHQLKRHTEVAQWLKTAQPLDEKGVLGKLAQPVSMLSDADAVQMIAACECVTKDRRLPRPSTRSQRLWGNPESLKADAGYQVQPLLLTVFDTIDPQLLSTILPQPLPHVSVVVAIVTAIQSELDALPDDGIDTPRKKRLRLHLRRALDDAAGGAGGADGVSNQQGLNDGDFETMLHTVVACRRYYDPAPGEFGRRIGRFVKGFNQRASVVCVDDSLIKLAELWVGCSADHAALRGHLAAWKTILSWFANLWDQSGRVPFKGFWTPRHTDPQKNIADLREAAHTLVPGIGPNYDSFRKRVLHEILQTYLKKGWLKSEKKGLTALFSKNDGNRIKQLLDHILQPSS